MKNATSALRPSAITRARAQMVDLADLEWLTSGELIEQVDLASAFATGDDARERVDTIGRMIADRAARGCTVAATWI